MTNHEQLEIQVKEEAQKLHLILDEMEKKIVGQNHITKRLLMAAISGGHVLLEGLPGLAKTTVIKTLAQTTSLQFKRIQFTPDLLPADIIGTQIFNPQTSEFQIKIGPIFSNFILADEINRAPAKVQSALLEAMEERQVTIGEKTIKLPDPFLVMATQNPVEQEGTYTLPEAQLDRFFFKLQISYGTKVQELQILKRALALEQDDHLKVHPVLQGSHLITARELTKKIYVSDKIREYMVAIIFATRGLEIMKDMSKLIEYGASPRGTLALDQGARVHALLDGRFFVTPQDVKDVAHDVLRHRIKLTFEAESENLTQDGLISRILERIDVP